MSGSAAPAQIVQAFDVGEAGAAIRSLRIARGWTLRELATRAGLSLSTLSRMETGQCGVTFERAHALASALGVTAATLLAQMTEASARTIAVSRFHGWRSFTAAGEGALVRHVNADHNVLCGDFLHRRMVASLVELKARSLAEHGPMVSQSGEAFVYVIDGPAVFASLGFVDLILKTGDSFQFDASVTHALFSGAQHDARVLLLASPDPKPFGDGA